MKTYRLQDIEIDQDRAKAQETYEYFVTPNMHPSDKVDLMHDIVRGYLEDNSTFHAQY